MGRVKDTLLAEEEDRMGIGKYFGYLAPKLRAEYIQALADRVMETLGDRDILHYTPQYYGPDVTPAHREYVREKAIKDLEKLDDYTLSRRYGDAMEPEGVVADSFKQGGYAGRKDLLN